MLHQFYFTNTYQNVHISNYSYSKRCGTSNIEVNRLADTESEQEQMSQGSESELSLIAEDMVETSVGAASVGNFACLNL